MKSALTETKGLDSAVWTDSREIHAQDLKTSTQKPTRAKRGFVFLVVLSVVFFVTIGSKIERTSLPCSSESPVELRTGSTRLETIRIGTFNLHSLRGKDGITRENLVAAMIHESNCDFLFVQEIRSPWIKNNVPQTKQLESYLNSRYQEKFKSLFLPTEFTWFHPYFGNGILSRVDMNVTGVTNLVSSRNKGYRQAVHMEIPMSRKTLHLLGTHLDLSQDHDPQLQEVLKIFDSLPEPKILLGDLNCTAEHPMMKSVCSSTHYTTKVDWIIPRGLGTGSEKKMNDPKASDHPLLCIEISEIPGNENNIQE